MSRFIIMKNRQPSVAESLDSVLKMTQRKLVVASQEILLIGNEPNDVFILMVEESRGSAGGRAAGSGHRRISRIIAFHTGDGRSDRFFDTQDQTIIDRFEIPYSAVAMDVTLSDNSPLVVQGITDRELTKSYLDTIANL
jgi:hypothetical protein